eukprot:746817_1
MTQDALCTTYSSISQNVSIVYGIVYGLFMLIVCVYSFQFVQKYSAKFVNSSLVTKVKIWCKDTWNRRGCYTPIIAHLFDQITDVSVAIEFYFLAKAESRKHNDWSDCNELNIWYLFILTILSMAIYRIISSFLIYQITGSLARFLLQMFDLELFRALHVNYICNSVNPCDPQRWITTLEATLESSPQALIQLIYLIKTNTFTSSYLVLISFISSILCIVSKLVSDDKIIVISKAKHFNGFSSWYVLRVLWRFLDITSNICIMTLIWIAMGGVALTFKVAVESVAFLFICIRTGQWEFLFGIIGMVISTSTKESTQLSLAIVIYKTCVNMVFMIMITIWLYVDFSCWACPDYSTRKSSQNHSALVIIFVYTWIGAILAALCTVALYTKPAFKYKASTSRRLDKMIVAKNYDGIIEMQLYRSQVQVYDEENQRTLLMLAMKQNNAGVVSYLLKRIPRYDAEDKNGLNILDYYSQTAANATKPMADNLVHIYQTNPKMRSKAQFTPFLLACYHGELACVKRIVQIDENVLQETAIDDLNGATLAQIRGHEGVVQYLNQNHDIQAQEVNFLSLAMENEYLSPLLPGFFIKNRKQMSSNNYTAFLCACYHGDLDAVQELLDLDGNDRNIETNEILTGFTLVKTGRHSHIVDYLQNAYRPVNAEDDNFIGLVMKHPNLTPLLVDLYRKYPDLRSKSLNKEAWSDFSAFLCACHHGDLQSVQKLIEIDEMVLKEERNGENAAYWAHLNGKKRVVNFLAVEYKMFTGAVNKVVFCASGQSGSSTMFKQFRNIYGEGYSTHDKRQFTQHVHAQIIEQMKECLGYMDHLKEEEPEEYKDLDLELTGAGKDAADVLRGLENPKLNPDIVDIIDLLWTEDAIRLIYDLRATTKIEDTSAYFWDDIRRVAARDYVPTEKDILYVRYRTTGVVDQNLKIIGQKFHIFNMGGQLSERKKWIRVFESVTAVLFVSALSSYNEVMFEDDQVNSMVDSIALFEQICNNERLKDAALFLFLNKKDLFAERIRTIPITECPAFASFEGDTTNYDETTEYIKQQFESYTEKAIYIHLTCAVDRNQMEKVYEDIIPMIISNNQSMQGVI